ncbi:hypothetical protein GQ457_12G003750 [Hibiscus cannabinus]
MQSTWLPKALCDEMEKLIRRFIWGSSTEKNGIHLVKWEELQRTVDNGGLGLKSLCQHNQAFLMKIGFQTNPEKFWVQVLRSKYGWEDPLPLSIKRTSASRLWRGLNEVWDMVKDSICWNNRDGRSTDFWYDNWLDGKGQLVYACTANANPSPVSVSAMVDEAGDWDWCRLSSWLPKDTLERIAAVMPPRLGLGDDRSGWRWEDNRKFTTRSAYAALSVEPVANDSLYWRQIWKLPVPQRIRVFVWLVFHRRLLTNDERARRHLTSSDRCSICNNGTETMDHVLRLCPSVRQVWESVIALEKLSLFVSLPFDNWLLQCLNMSMALEKLHRSTWSCPEWGWLKVNCDGAVNSHDKAAAIGGVVRDSTGTWQFGFSRSIGRCSIIMAELWAVLDSLRHSWDLGYRCLRLETDNLEATEIINSTSSAFEDSLLLHDIKGFMSRDWRVQLRHIPRSENSVADKLARMSMGAPIGETLFARPPLKVIPLLEKDLINIVP